MNTSDMKAFEEGDILVGATLLNLFLNLIWIPAHGAIGAAWSTVACEVALVIILCFGPTLDFVKSNCSTGRDIKARDCRSNRYSCQVIASLSCQPS